MQRENSAWRRMRIVPRAPSVKERTPPESIVRARSPDIQKRVNRIFNFLVQSLLKRSFDRRIRWISEVPVPPCRRLGRSMRVRLASLLVPP